MATIAEIIDQLQHACGWQDGESFDTILQRLSPEQLALPGSITIRVSERGNLPWMLRAFVKVDDVLLFEVAQRLPQGLTHEEVMKWKRMVGARVFL